VKDEDRENLRRRWDELNRELEELLDGKVQAGNVDHAARETALHVELDRIEYELGREYLERNRRERSEP
jgi:Mor family transcriptional regulator